MANIFDSIRNFLTPNFNQQGQPNLAYRVMQPLAGVQQGAMNIAKAPQAPLQIKAPTINLGNPVVNFAANLPGQLVAGAVNAPGQYIQGIARTGVNLGQGNFDPKQLLSSSAQIAQLPLMFVGGGEGISVLTAPKALGAKVLTGAAQGAKFGGAFGALNALQTGSNIQNNSDYFKNILSQTAQGMLVGGAFGAVTPLAGEGISKVVKGGRNIFNAETSKQFLNDLVLENPHVTNHNAINPFTSAFRVNDATFNDVASAVSTLRNRIGDVNATRTIKTATAEFLPQFSKLDTLSQRNIWDYIVTRRAGEAPSFIPPQLKGLDKAILDTSGRTVATTGKINFGEFLPKKSQPKGELPVNPTELPTVPVVPTEKVSLPKIVPPESKPNLSTQDYLKSQIEAQKAATQPPQVGVKAKVGGFWGDIKRKLVDSAAPIEDILYNTRKKVNIAPSNDISLQIDRVYRSRVLAAQFAKDNGLVDVIRGVPDVNALDQYLIAKHALEVSTKTGRNVAQDKALIEKLAPVYEPYAQKVIQYGNALLDYAQQSGLVSKETADFLKKKYPNYVPLNRIFTALEQASVPDNVRGGLASLSKQTVVQKLKGSERAIQNPTESILNKTLDAFNQGERNIAGRMLASYKDLPGFKGLIRELKYKGQNSNNTFSFLDNGKKRVFETTPEIAQAAKLLDKQQLGFIGKVFALPVRIARLGITGINVPFLGANIAKDQVTAAINSNKALQTSIINPPVFLKALWEAIGHGKEYDNWIRSAGGGTSFDIAREAPNVTIGQLRAGRSIGSNIAYTVTHPGNLLRTVENIVNRGEELTRLQQFIGTKQSLLNQGMSVADATILAAKQSREATVNFARSGDWGRALNSVFLYMNAGIQGSRTLVRSLRTNPVATSAKIALTVFTPLAAVTVWNLSDPQRKAAYDDIRNFEKDNNLVLIPPNPTKDPKTGKWNVIKVPFSQEIANLTVPIRKGIEAMHGADPPDFSDLAKALLGTTTSLNVQNPQQLAGQFTPQAVKPVLEATLNKNLFTGQDIVPQYLNGVPSKYLPPSEQVKPNTSGTARLIGKATNVSPIKIEQGIRDTFGGVGSQVINAADNALAATGMIPKDQIGGQSIPAGITARFNLATGGQTASNISQDTLTNAVAKVIASPAYQKADPTMKASLINKAIYAANKQVSLKTAALGPNFSKPKKIKLKSVRAKTAKLKMPKAKKAKTVKLTTKAFKPKKVPKFKIAKRPKTLV